MSDRPSIKGSVFTAVVEDVNKLVADGRVSAAELDRWLEPGDRALLEARILVSSWYGIDAYARMNRLLCDVEGSGSHEYLREKGRETARRLLRAGLYAQLEYLKRVEVVTADGAEHRFAAFGRDLRRLTTMSASILNFSKWVPEPDPEHEGRYRIVVSEARDYPEPLCWRSDGFVNEMGAQHEAADLWRWERTAPDVIVFRMLRDL
jgi:hypothetical protein